MFQFKRELRAVVLLVVGVMATGTGRLESLRAAPADDKGRIDVPVLRDGRIALIGTELKQGDDVPVKDRVTIDIGFLAVELGDKDDPKLKGIMPESWWDQLDHSKVYARWTEGVPLTRGKLHVVSGKREYRKLHVGDSVEEGQMLALVDMEPALEALTAKIEDLESAEAEYVAAGKTKQEAERRAKESQRLYELKTGVISLDAYYADLLSAARYAQEERIKELALHHAARAVHSAAVALKTCEVRSSEKGVVQEILKGRGEAVHELDGVVRIQIADAPVPTIVHVPALRDGVLLVVGTEIKEGEKVPADRVVAVKINGEDRRYRRLREGDEVEEGQLLAQIDNRLARLDVEGKAERVEAAKAEAQVADRTRAEAERRLQALTDLRNKNKNLVPDEDYNVTELNVERCAEEMKGKMTAVKGAELELKAAETILQMYEVRSPVRGVVKTIGKNRGEAVRSLEPILEIEERAKE